MVVRDKNNVPSARAEHRWSSRFVSRFKNRLGFGSSFLRFKSYGETHQIELKGVHLQKMNYTDVENKARLMRKTGGMFYLLVDRKEHGVSQLSRKRGGYFLYEIARVNNKYVVNRHFYSEKTVSKLGLDGLSFAHCFWRIFRHCYYGVAIEEIDGGGNSS